MNKSNLLRYNLSSECEGYEINFRKPRLLQLNRRTLIASDLFSWKLCRKESKEQLRVFISIDIAQVLALRCCPTIRNGC